MIVALKSYEQLTEATDDRERFQLIVDAIGALEEGRLNSADLARTTDVHATELRLQQALHRQTLWIIGAVGAVVGLIRLLDYLLA